MGGTVVCVMGEKVLSAERKDLKRWMFPIHSLEEVCSKFSEAHVPELLGSKWFK